MTAIARTPADYETFRITAADTNYMALIADPIRDKVPFTAFVEVFDIGGKTPPNTHSEAHELFYILAGEGIATSAGESRAIRAGDSVVVTPGNEHVIENTGTQKLYCLTVMIPNEGFAELVRSGLPMKLDGNDIKTLAG